jgi:hypothetical protein
MSSYISSHLSYLFNLLDWIYIDEDEIIKALGYELYGPPIIQHSQCSQPKQLANFSLSHT